MCSLCALRCAIFIIAVLTVEAQISEDFDYTNYIAPCRRSDPLLNKCLQSAFQRSRKEFASGLWFPGLQVMPLDPFNLQNHTFGTDSFVKIITHNMTVHGLSGYIVESYKINLRDFTVDMTLLFPRISDTGIYSANVGILGMKLNGEFRSSYKETRAKIRFEAHKEIRGGVDYLNIDNVFLRSDKVFRAIFASHPMHNVLIPAVYPMLERSYGLIIRDELNKVLDAVPFDVLLPN